MSTPWHNNLLNLYVKTWIERPLETLIVEQFRVLLENTWRAQHKTDIKLLRPLLTPLYPEQIVFVSDTPCFVARYTGFHVKDMGMYSRAAVKPSQCTITCLQKSSPLKS